MGVCKNFRSVEVSYEYFMVARLNGICRANTIFLFRPLWWEYSSGNSWYNLRKQRFVDVFQNRYSLKFRYIHTKIPNLESLFNIVLFKQTKENSLNSWVKNRNSPKEETLTLRSRNWDSFFICDTYVFKNLFKEGLMNSTLERG